MTNFDVIKEMSIERMAKFLANEVGCANCSVSKDECELLDCYIHFLDWLGSAATITPLVIAKIEHDSLCETETYNTNLKSVTDTNVGSKLKGGAE